MPLRQLSFWKMKDRGRRFGEGAANDLLRSLQVAAPSARFHLVGHSFGCIAVSAAVAGPPDRPPLPRPVTSLFLVQGAMSLWSMCPDVPFAPGTAGYFSRIRAGGLVTGPIITTRSAKDTAVGLFYPLGARVKRQLLLDGQSYPRYGGTGTFGLQGLDAQDVPIHDPSFAYRLEPGSVYNVEASDVIAYGGFPSGAHSDIAHPEVAHLQWQAVLAAAPRPDW
jgi:pimeloyl-ACP methyl ester carboxylesterase